MTHPRMETTEHQPLQPTQGARVAHIDYPGCDGTITGDAGQVGGHPAMVVQWDDGLEEAATWTHKLIVR